ncbi:malate synthase [Citrobacter koseri]|nr:malate synthase [Citrobacter koseri]
MNQQATTTDELTFTRPHGEQEKQILTAEAVEFSDRTGDAFYAKA